MSHHLSRVVSGAVVARRWLGAALLGCGAVVVAGCDPCSGVVGCEGNPRVAIEGEMIVYATGEPAPGVTIEFERTGGAAVGASESTAVTDEEGRFRLTLVALEAGEVLGSITVRPPGRPAYTVEDLRFHATRWRGDATILPDRWVVDPYIDFLGELFDRSTGRPIGFGAHVSFRRTGGIRIEPDSVHAVTDHFGRFHFDPVPAGQGEVVGRLTVAGVVGTSYRVTSIPNVRIRTSHVERPLGIQGVWHLGPALEYVGELHFRASGDPVVGAQVDFRRTGGIAAEPEFVRVTTNEDGRFPLLFRPESDGVLVGELTVRPGPGYGTEVIAGVELPTFEGTELRLLNVWAVGPTLGYVGELRWSDTGEPVVGARARLRRTGGIPTLEEEFVDTTNEAGRFRMMPVPLAEGELVASLEVELPAPSPTFSTEVRLSTFNSDGVRSGGTWHVPR